MYNLGDYYEEIENDYKLMGKYYLLAFNKEFFNNKIINI